ncbi:MAG: hypothetical protein M0R03_13205 [Novosphingobium sp.]|nr:hypothetical protein [Novosphingobium sp.]
MKINNIFLSLVSVFSLFTYSGIIHGMIKNSQNMWITVREKASLVTDMIEKLRIMAVDDLNDQLGLRGSNDADYTLIEKIDVVLDALKALEKDT